MQNNCLSYAELMKLKKKLHSAQVVEHYTFIVHPDSWYHIVRDYGAEPDADRHDIHNLTFVKVDRLPHA